MTGWAIKPDGVRGVLSKTAEAGGKFEAEPGEPTYYGHAEGYGLKAPDIIDGRGPDLTDAAFG